MLCEISMVLTTFHSDSVEPAMSKKPISRIDQCAEQP